LLLFVYLLLVVAVDVLVCIDGVDGDTTKNFSVFREMKNEIKGFIFSTNKVIELSYPFFFLFVTNGSRVFTLCLSLRVDSNIMGKRFPHSKSQNFWIPIFLFCAGEL
jgi:hypothetical protein